MGQVEAKLDFGPNLRAKLGPSWAKLGQVGAKLGPSWGQVGPSWRSKGSSFFCLLFGSFLGATWHPICTQLGSKIGPNLMSKWCPRGREEHQANLAKTLKNHWFFNVFGVSGVPRYLQNPTRKVSKIEVNKHINLTST